ncbi:MAG: CBS domain-containing protein [Rhodospirillaceae bacterium]|jgi:CBS domain-containing protein
MMNLRIIPDVVEESTIHGLRDNDSVLDGANLMDRHDISAVVIFDEDGKLTGIVTERDLARRVLADGLDPETTPLSDVMTDNPDTLSPDDAVYDALELMRTRRYRHLPVVKESKIVAMVSIRDLYESVQDALEQSMRETEALVFSGDNNNQ